MRQLCKRRRSIFPKRKLRCFCPRHLRIKRRTRWFSRLMHFQMRVPYSLESFRKCFADGTSLCSVTSSRYSEHRARPWFGSITAGDLPSDPIDEHNTEYLLGKYQHFPYKTIKGNANKTLPPTQCQVPVYQLPVIIYIRRPRGGAVLEGTRGHTHVVLQSHERSPARQPRGHQGWPGDAAQGKIFPVCCSTEIHSEAQGLGKAHREAHLSQTQAKSELQLPDVSQHTQKW